MGFFNIECFNSRLPQDCVSDLTSYDGDFAKNELSRGNDWLKEACYFELSESMRGIIGTMEKSASPPWFWSDQNLPQLFQQYIGKGELANAWLTLNSRGWLFSDARKALVDLDKAANDSEFSKLVTAWLSITDTSAGSY